MDDNLPDDPWRKSLGDYIKGGADSVGDFFGKQDTPGPHLDGVVASAENFSNNVAGKIPGGTDTLAAVGAGGLAYAMTGNVVAAGLFGALGFALEHITGIMDNNVGRAIGTAGLLAGGIGALFKGVGAISGIGSNWIKIPLALTAIAGIAYGAIKEGPAIKNALGSLFSPAADAPA